MLKKEGAGILLQKTVKTLVVFFTLSAIGWFVDLLPFARALPFLSFKLTIGVFLGSVISLLMLLVLVMFGSEAAPAVEPLLEFIPKAGKLFVNLVRIGAVLFAYYSFQPAVFPFIPEYEWAYQEVFLGLILFFLARLGLLMYAASEAISRFLLGFLSPYHPARDVKEVRPPN